MISEAEFQSLMHSVVEKCIPDEIDALEVGGEDIVACVYRTGHAPPQATSPAEFEMVSNPKAIIEFIPVAIATYKALKALLFPAPKKEVVSLEVVQKEWALKLQTEGLPAELAAAIVAKCGELVADHVAKQQPPQPK